MNKKELNKHLITQQHGIIADLKAEIESYHAGKDLDEEDTLDPEDFSHQTEAGQIEHNLREQLKKAEAEMDFLESMDDEPRSEIGPGALVQLKDRYIYVSIATLPFEHEGKEVISISTSAPIYPEIRSKKVGDSIQLGPNSYKVLSIE